MLATRSDKFVLEGLAAGLGLLELIAQQVDVVIVRRSGGFRGLRRRGIVQSLDSLVHGLLLVVGEQVGEVRAGNGQSCQYTIAVAGDATLEGGRGKGVFITNVKGTFFGMSESEEASSSEISICKAADGVEEQMHSPQCLKNPFEKG